MKRLYVVVLALALIVSACGGKSESPASPTPTTTVPPTQTFTLSGTIIDASTGNGIAGATARIVDGLNAGRNVTANANGSYSLTNLQAGPFILRTTATYFLTAERSVSLTSNTTLDVRMDFIPPFTRSGKGNTVFDMPSSFTRVRIQGTWDRTQTSNFIVRIGGRLVVNEILRDSITYDGIHLTNGGGVTEIVSSNQISWIFTEVRP